MPAGHHSSLKENYGECKFLRSVTKWHAGNFPSVKGQSYPGIVPTFQEYLLNLIIATVFPSVKCG